jgi:hypothetical protein
MQGDGAPPPSLLNLGICVRRSRHWLFQQLKTDPGLADEIVYQGSNPCELYPTSYALQMPHAFRNRIANDHWITNVEAPLNTILDDANKNYHDLRKIIMSSPYISLYARWSSSVLGAAFNAGFPCCCQALLFMLLIPIWFIVGIPLLIYKSTCAFRGSPAEITWMQTELGRVPHMDCLETENIIAIQMRNLAGNLTATFPSFRVVFWRGTKRITGATESESYDQDLFVLQFFNIHGGFISPGAFGIPGLGSPPPYFAGAHVAPYPIVPNQA